MQRMRTRNTMQRDVLEYPVRVRTADAQTLDGMENLSKVEKKTVLELLAEAHEAELGQELVTVEQALQEWRAGKISAGHVNETIHRFHKESQEIFKTYNYAEPLIALAHAVANGFMSLERVPESLRGRVENLIKITKGDDAV